MNSLTEPQFPFDGYEEYDYTRLMEDILRVETVQAIYLGNWLIEHLHPSSVIDLGCGPGIYLVPFGMRGIEVFGVDGCSVAGACLDRVHQFQRVDLRFPYRHEVWSGTRFQKYRLALCLETAEHLPANFAETLVNTISHCADMVMFTAATPGQGGLHHHNERPVSYWRDMFFQVGYWTHPLQDELHAFLQTLPDYCAGWLKNNSMLLTR